MSAVKMQRKTRPPTASTSPTASQMVRSLLGHVHGTPDHGDQVVALAIAAARMAGLRGADRGALYRLMDHVYEQALEDRAKRERK